MAIKNWLIRGDTHGQFQWMTNGCLDNYKPEETAIIILGDCGLDFYLNKTDTRKKKEIDSMGYYIYWLRGNHEARPSDIPDYDIISDPNVHGEVYCDFRYPHIRAFLDYGFYQIDKYSCLIVGGAYSIDKYWRLMRYGFTEETNNPKITGWFSNEQLTKEEMADCLNKVKLFTSTGKAVDFVMTHTCPLSFQPTDMFLHGVDQSKVDNSMEVWLEEVKDNITWFIWLYGHYHADRIEQPYVEQYYRNIEELTNIYDRWKTFSQTGELPWYINKSPNFKN